MRTVILLSLLVIFAARLPAVADDEAIRPVDETAMVAWASGIATETLTYDFEDYPKVFDHAKRNFTPEGWQGLQASLDNSGIHANLIKYQQTVYTQQNSTSPPKVETRGMKDGVSEWTVSIPLVQTVVAGNKSATRLVTITMTILEGPTIMAGSPMARLPTLTVVHWDENLPAVHH